MQASDLVYDLETSEAKAAAWSKAAAEERDRAYFAKVRLRDALRELPEGTVLSYGHTGVQLSPIDGTVRIVKVMSAMDVPVKEEPAEEEESEEPESTPVAAEI